MCIFYIYILFSCSEGKAADASLKETLEELEQERKLTVSIHVLAVSV